MNMRIQTPEHGIQSCFLRNFLLLILERGRGGEEKERNINVGEKH